MKRLLVVPFILITIPLFAAPIGEQRARNIASSFFASSATRSSAAALELEWAGSNMEETEANSAISRTSGVGQSQKEDEALLYIYNRADAKGFVVVAGDDRVKRPIIAFSHNNHFDIENMPDAAKAILQAWCKQVDAARNTKTQSVATRADATVGNVVRTYETATWSQGAPFNIESPIVNGEKSVTGCVATAMSIILYYYRYPSQGVGTIPKYTYKEGGITQTVPENVLGRTYEYDKMLPSYTSSYTDEQGAAVAALMYDAGTSVNMEFGPSASSSNSRKASIAMAKYFGYTKSGLHIPHVSYSEEEWTAMLQQNLDQFGPTLYGGAGDSGGHIFVLDGYTDAGYFRINYGWAGKSNGYYLLPNISFYINQSASFGMKPDPEGTSQYVAHIGTSSHTSSKGTLYRGLYTDASSYEVGTGFKMYVGIYNMGLDSFTGKVIVAHCDKDDNIKTILYTKSISNLKATGNTGYTPTGTLVEPVEPGDCLRMFYRVSDNDEWSVARSTVEAAYDKVLLSASPQQVEESLSIAFDKENKTFTFTSKHAIQCTIMNESGSVVKSASAASFTTGTIDLSDVAKGKYTFSFASGGEPYKINVKL